MSVITSTAKLQKKQKSRLQRQTADSVAELIEASANMIDSVIKPGCGLLGQINNTPHWWLPLHSDSESESVTASASKFKANRSSQKLTAASVAAALAAAARFF